MPIYYNSVFPLLGMFIHETLVSYLETCTRMFITISILQKKTVKLTVVYLYKDILFRSENKYHYIKTSWINLIYIILSQRAIYSTISFFYKY